MYERILVAVDDSDTANLALQESIKLAGELKARLRLVHVIDVIGINLGADFPYPVEVLDATSKRGRAILDQAGEAAREAGIPFETGLVEINRLGQRIPDVIVADAEAWPADLVVVGTHGRRGLGHLLLGSVAEGVVRLASKPVLLIRGK